MKLSIVFVFFFTLFGVNLYSQENEVENEVVIPEIDSLLQKQIKESSPGCVVGVINDGDFIHKKAYGLANLDYDIPLTTSSVFRIASTSNSSSSSCSWLGAGEILIFK